MNSESQVRLPVIDFSKQDLKPGTAEWELVKVQVRQALEEYGCFEALYDEVMEIRKPLIGALEELFDLPLQTKQRYVSEKVLRGYFAPLGPKYESMTIDEANVAENVEQGLANVLWPQGNTSFSKTLLSFSALTSKLEQTIRRMVLESFGLEKYMVEHMDFTNYAVRIMRYEGPQTSKPTIGSGAHTDMNMLTLLHQINEVNGLEIQTKDGEWIDVKPSPSSVIVMIGESLSVWLNGRLPSPIHRVMLMEDKNRYCAGLFAGPKGGYMLKVPKELSDEENPLLFKPFDYEEFLEFYSIQIAQRTTAGNGLKAYCSV